MCGKDLANVGFFVENNQYFCPEDFQERFGTKCIVCQLFVEGEGINIGGNAYHLRCFVCATCGWVLTSFVLDFYMTYNAMYLVHVQLITTLYVIENMHCVSLLQLDYKLEISLRW